MRSKYLVSELLTEITHILTPNIPRASREAQLLLMAYLDKDELWLITNQKTKLQNLEKLFEWVERRLQNEPFEYITQRVSFYSEEFFIKEGSLIPRPETELLIDEVIKNFPDKNAKITFVEVGIGSGIISIILARHFLNARFIAVDISQDALDIAKINIAKFELSKRIELRLGSLLQQVSLSEAFQSY
jgi:release factor glutamine methyltransferase